MALKSCRKCGASISTEAQACPHCGVTEPTKEPTALQFCRECGANISPAARACPQCGAPNPLGQQSPATKDKPDRRTIIAAGAAIMFILVLVIASSSWMSAPAAPPDPPKEENVAVDYANMSEAQLINALPLNYRSALLSLQEGNRRAAAVSLKAQAETRAPQPDAKMLAILDAIIQKEERGGPYLYSQGNEHLANRQYDLAIEKFSEAISVGDKKSYDGRGMAWLKKQEYERAIADFTQAEEYEHGNYLIYLHRAEANEQKGDREAAIADYRRALTLAPDKTTNDRIKATLQPLLPPQPPPPLPPPGRRAPAPAGKRS
jgi:tetratricopeptide (TPR) repeat protein/ribosomal protein L40E